MINKYVTLKKAFCSSHSNTHSNTGIELKCYGYNHRLVGLLQPPWHLVRALVYMTPFRSITLDSLIQGSPIHGITMKDSNWGAMLGHGIPCYKATDLPFELFVTDKRDF